MRGKCVACWGLAFGTAVVAVIAALFGLSSFCNKEAGLVEVTNPNAANLRRFRTFPEA